MKNILKGALILFAGVGMMAQENTITQELGEFDEIKAFDRLNITLIKSDENKAIISGDDTDDVSIVNKDGRLKTRMELDDTLAGHQTKITIYHTNALELIDANEGAKIQTESTLNAKYLSLRSQEGGEIHTAIDTRNLNAKSVTGGKIKVTGNAENQEIMVRTGGDFDGQHLSAKQTDVTIMAGGNAVVKTAEYVDATVTAGGTIEIYGNPETVKEDKTLGGEIIVRK